MGVGAASVAVGVVVVSTGASVAPTVELGSVAAVVVTAGTGRVARQVFTSVAVVSSLVQHASKMASW